MMQDEAITLQHDKEKAEHVLKTLELPEEIERVTVEPGFDHDGDPAIRVKLWIRTGLEFDPVIAERLNQFSTSVQFALLDGALSAYPYTTLAQAA